MKENRKFLQSYALTMSRHKLSVLQMRVFALTLEQLKTHQSFRDEKDRVDILQIEIKNADITVGTNYSQVEECLQDLRKKNIKIQRNGKSVLTGLILYSEYSDDGTIIKINIQKEILPELLFLSNYTQLGIDFFFKTQSQYAIRWYALACHWKNNGSFSMCSHELRTMMSVDQSSYKNHDAFFKRVIGDPLKDLKNKADIWLEVAEKKKEGRRIVGYTFNVHIKDIHQFAVEDYEQEKKKPRKRSKSIAKAPSEEKTNICTKAHETWHEVFLNRFYLFEEFEPAYKKFLHGKNFSSKEHFKKSAMTYFSHFLAEKYSDVEPEDVKKEFEERFKKHSAKTN